MDSAKQNQKIGAMIIRVAAYLPVLLGHRNTCGGDGRDGFVFSVRCLQMITVAPTVEADQPVPITCLGTFLAASSEYFIKKMG
jgi:hypothetical protein